MSDLGAVFTLPTGRLLVIFPQTQLLYYFAVLSHTKGTVITGFSPAHLQQRLGSPAIFPF